MSSVSLGGPSEAGVRVLSLAAPPVNTLTWEVFDEIDAAMVEAENDDTCRAIVITAEKPGVFTAGLNLKELHRPDESRLKAYWKKMQRLYMSVYGSSKYCVAAINGAAPAGGCFLSLLCDYRVLADSPKCIIGLNETQLGLAPPIWFYRLYQRVMSPALAERHIALGTLFSPAEALTIGLVDEICPMEDVQAAALKRAQEAAQIDHSAIANVRKTIRADDINWLSTNAEVDAAAFQSQVTSTTLQHALDVYMDRLSARKKK